MWSQTNALVNKFRNKMWTLRDLRKAGFSEDELIRVYKSSILPIIEYSPPLRTPPNALKRAVGLHWQATNECLKKRIRLCLQCKEANRTVRASKPEREERRGHQKICSKTSDNPRFQAWSPKERLDPGTLNRPTCLLKNRLGLIEEKILPYITLGVY